MSVTNDPRPASRYELIIVASREARRLNDYYRQRGIQPKKRITTEAIGRVFDGEGVPYEFLAKDLPVEDHSAELSVDGDT